MIACATGHRPERCGGYTFQVWDRLKQTALFALEEQQPSSVICGMALGWDTAVAVSCVTLGIPFMAYCPFVSQDMNWNDHSKLLYQQLLARAESVVYPSENHQQSYGVRDRAMVNDSDVVLALNSQKGHSGTQITVDYAVKLGNRTIYNYWDYFRRLS